MSRAYYNEKEPYAAQWLRNLIEAGHIAPGDVDERSIEDVTKKDLAGYTQCHFFAGVGIWSAALRGAGWPDRRRVWTGSCPCQPFSAAGKSGGFADERHLWPAWFHLITQCGPDVIYGEQVASKDGLAWFDLVHADLENAGHAVGAGDFCAAGFGAPHIRQRLYFVADASRVGQWSGSCHSEPGRLGRDEFANSRDARIVADSVGHGLQGCADLDLRGTRRPDEGRTPGCGRGTPANGLEHSGRLGWERGQTPAPGNEPVGEASDRPKSEHGACAASPHRISEDRAGPTNGEWRNADWLLCRDGKWRPVESGAFPLAHGDKARVGRLRAYGNAIVEAQARAFIEATM